MVKVAAVVFFLTENASRFYKWTQKYRQEHRSYAPHTSAGLAGDASGPCLARVASMANWRPVNMSGSSRQQGSVPVAGRGGGGA